MKYVLISAIVLLVFWLWQRHREADRIDAQSARPRPAATKSEVTEMVACDVCQVHLPRSEALIGHKGVYCSDAHRRQAGD